MSKLNQPFSGRVSRQPQNGVRPPLPNNSIETRHISEGAQDELRFKKNYIINGNFDFWQREVSFVNPAQSTYTADRWVSYNATVDSLTVQRQNISSLGLGSTYALRSERSSGTAPWNIQTDFETSALNEVKGKYVTFSALLRKGPALTSDLEIYIQTSTTEARDSSTIEFAVVSIPNASLSSTFTRFSVSLLIPSDTAALGFRAGIAVGSQLGAGGAYFDITQAMLNEGSDVHPFIKAGITMDGELAACQRFYEKSYNQDIFPGHNFGSLTAAGDGNRLMWSGVPDNSGNSVFNHPWKVVKRAIPAVSTYDGNGVAARLATSTDGGAYVSNNPSGLEPGHDHVAIYDGGATNRMVFIGFIVADAEL